MPGLVPIRLPRQRSTNTVWTDWMRAKRYIETTWLVTSYEFVGFDNTTDSYSRQVVMK